MAKAKDKAREALSYISAIQSILEKYPDLEHLDAELANQANNGIEFLINILKELGQYDRMVQWLANYIVYLVPALEVAVKGILLANLKIACSVDPRIPRYMRKRSKDVPKIDDDDVESRGVLLNVQSFDYTSILETSPFSHEGRYNYFGVLEAQEEKIYDPEKKKKPITTYKFVPTTSLYGLARAEDFNAFLWFVINKGKLSQPKGFETVDEFKSVFGVSTSELNLLKENKFLPDTVSVTGSSSSLLQGVTIFQRSNNPELSSDVLALCIDCERNDDGFITSSTVVPVSDTRNSENWYVNRSNYFNANLTEKKKKPRDYTKEMAICNLEYIEQEDDYYFKYSSITGQKLEPFEGAASYYVNFTILPKPLILMPKRTIKFILFNENGEMDKNGKYSINTDRFYVTPFPIPTGKVREVCTAIINKTGLDELLEGYIGMETSEKLVYPVINRKDGEFVAYLLFDKSDLKYTLEPAIEGEEGIEMLCLREVYRGLTVYEFNYDFVMGMRLYDSKVITAQLISAVLGMDFGLNFYKDTTQLEVQAEITEIMHEIMYTEDKEVSDCYYSFSNSKYDRMRTDAELKRAALYPINFNPATAKQIDAQTITRILDEFDQVETLNEQVDVITRAVNQVCVSVQEASGDKVETDGLRVNVVCSLIQSLMTILMNAIISPKVAMLIQVNEELMGSHKDNLNALKSFNLKEFLKKMRNFFVKIAREIMNALIAALWDLVKSILLQLLEQVGIYLLREMLSVYKELLSNMIKQCGGLANISLNNGQLLETPIADATYADTATDGDKYKTSDDVPVTGQC